MAACGRSIREEKGVVMTRGRRTFIAVGSVAVVGVCCGIAFAAVTLPFSGDGNTINGCYSDRGQVVLLTPSDPQCPKKYHSIQWNVTGPRGLPGTNGVSPTVAQLASGDSHCPGGGASITDAGNTTAYVCSATPFSGTFTAGDYSISVTSSGITLKGPSSEKITLTGSGITVDGGGVGGVKAKSVVGMTFESATTLNLKATSTKVEGTAILDLTGALTRLNGGCSPVAHVTDLVRGTVVVPAVSTVVPITATIVPTGPGRVLSC
jgi:hypothetical protein